ncbi:hypothetical protein [Caudoviricetes sp.]|nr:hypothetical protein [Caudoviricetes sp.]
MPTTCASGSLWLRQSPRCAPNLRRAPVAGLRFTRAPAARRCLGARRSTRAASTR